MFKFLRASRPWWRRLLPVLLPTLGGPCPTFRDQRIEPAMAQRPTRTHDLPAESDHHVVLLPTQYVPHVPTKLLKPSAGRAAIGRQVRARKHAILQVVVLEVAGRLSDGAEDLDRAIQLALAEGPRGVVCDLSAVFEGAGPAAVDGAGPVAVEVLASAGRHVRDWPGIPVAVACPDPRVREAPSGAGPGVATQRPGSGSLAPPIPRRTTTRSRSGAHPGDERAAPREPAGPGRPPPPGSRASHEHGALPTRAPQPRQVRHHQPPQVRHPRIPPTGHRPRHGAPRPKPAGSHGPDPRHHH